MRSPNLRNLRAFTLVATLVPPFFVQASMEAVGEPTASFDGKGPAGFKLRGATHQLELKDDGKTLTLIVPLATLQTGIALRDQHMREKYLEVTKYPQVVLEVLWSSLQVPEDGRATQSTGTGKLSLHGTVRPITFTYSAKRTGKAIQVSGTAPLDLRDYGISIPSYMGLTVKPDLVTAVTFTATQT
jgi:polyisoprenoid-binding protein YceI